jgi:hypothetical protein
MIAAESTIMALNLILPVVALRYIFGQTGDVGASEGFLLLIVVLGAVTAL